MEELTSHALIGRVEELLARERKIVVAFLQHLGEVERRRLHLEMGFGSLFLYCTDRLKLSTGTAWRRVTAVKLIRMHPVIGDYLIDGRLSLASLGELKDVLAGDDARQILERAAGKTQLQVKELVVAIRPSSVKRDVIRPVSKPSMPGQGDLFATPAPAPAPVRVSKAEPIQRDQAGPAAPGVSNLEFHAAAVGVSRVAVAAPVTAAAAPIAPGSTLVSKAEVRATVVPVAPETYRLHANISATCKDKLARATSLLSHTVPDGRLDRILEICFDHALTNLEKKRGKVSNPRPGKPATGRRPTAQITREVFARDGQSCAYVAPDGTRCNSTYQLELDHLEAFALDGPTTTPNLSPRCSAHNRFHAENDFGRDVIEAHIKAAGDI